MFAALTRTTDAATEPLTTAEAKTHLRVTHSDDDTYIAALIAAARQAVESYCNRSLITQTWEATFDCFDNSRLRLPYPRLISVTTVHYKDSNGDYQLYAASNYEVNSAAEPGQIRFINTPSYNSEYENPLKVTYTAGYGAASDVPENLKVAIKLLIGHWYEMREAAVAVSGGMKEIPLGLQWTLNPFRHIYS